MIEPQFIGIIPARFASSRFPGKPLVEINGKTMIRRVVEQAQKSSMLQRVIVATDDLRIEEEVRSFGAEVWMTSADHPSGTDRCAEVVRAMGSIAQENAVIINIQGDEPFIDPAQIDTLCSCFQNENVELGTLVRRFSNTDDILNPSMIKVVRDINGFGIYFSRLPIPFERDAEAINLDAHFQHIGLYGYRASTLLKIAALETSFLENTEKLEQLRWIENGYKIMTALSNHESWSIDTPQDLKKIQERFI
jgi:3-deoxy-manno-octulosonate cytidylyltransferase (CMP-KDO synthetase)